MFIAILPLRKAIPKTRWHRVTRGIAQVVNGLQMALAESYIHGLELPDSALRAISGPIMPILFRHFPSLLVPYEWVARETDHLAEGSQELMKIQYDRPQAC